METLEQQLNSEVARILEEWAMMIVEPDQKEPTLFAETDECLVASLEFRGQVSGVYTVVCDDEFARTLSRNLLGGEADPSAQEVDDAVAEMVNVIGGNMLTTAYGEHMVFALTAPTVRHVSFAHAGEALSGTALWYRADGAPVAVGFKPLEVSHAD